MRKIKCVVYQKVNFICIVVLVFILQRTMATANVTAQHFVECDSCEENPANFLCKTCPGHLCDTCKTEHEKKRMSQNHEIVNLGAGNDKVVDLLFCAKHTNKKLECYCVQCNSPICTDCIIKSHNSHFVRALSSVYKEIRDDLSMKKEEIDNIILPKYRGILAKDEAKRLAMLLRFQEVAIQIDKHSENIVEVVKNTTKDTKKQLLNEQRKILKEIDDHQLNVKAKIKMLEQTSETLSSDLTTEPSISFFKLKDFNLLDRFQAYPIQTVFSISNFKPGCISERILKNFGKLPKVQRTNQPENKGSDNTSYKMPAMFENNLCITGKHDENQKD